MQMTLRARIIDLLPIIVLFTAVTLFAMAMLVRFVADEPLRVPPPQTIPQDELPAGTPPEER